MHRAAFAGLLLCAATQFAAAQATHPVIIIPGLTGSELRNPATKERIWFSPFRPKSGRIALTLNADPATMRDTLVATDAIRSIKVAGIVPVDIYGGMIKALESRGRYHEEKWDKPSARGGDAAVYVFAYDWRRDNVSNARLLIRQIDELRRKIGKPDLKFDIVAHSMGGIIARYAAMYGDADLPPAGQELKPTWAGSAYIDKLVMVGTPNEGAMNAFNALVNGFTYKGLRVDLPFFQDTSKYVVFSLPTVFQLMPAPGTVHAFDEHLKPMDLDLYDPQVWKKYGWDVTRDPDFVEHFTAAERRVADTYFANALSRAKRLHLVLAAANGMAKVDIYAVGCDCRSETPDGVVVYQDGSGAWRTQFDPAGFTRADGTRVAEAEVRRRVFAQGDGIVPFHSVNASLQSSAANVGSIFGAAPAENICEEHNTQATNSKIQDYIIKLLTGIAAVPRQQLATARP